MRLPRCRSPLIAPACGFNDVAWRICCTVHPHNCHAPPNDTVSLGLRCSAKCNCASYHISNQQSDVRGPRPAASIASFASYQPLVPRLLTAAPKPQIYARHPSTLGRLCVACHVLYYAERAISEGVCFGRRWPSAGCWLLQNNRPGWIAAPLRAR